MAVIECVINLSFDGGWGGVESTQVFFIYFLLKNSLLDHTLTHTIPTCKFLILAIFYQEKKHPENLINKKFYYIRYNKIMYCVDFFFEW